MSTSSSSSSSSSFTLSYTHKPSTATILPSPDQVHFLTSAYKYYCDANATDAEKADARKVLDDEKFLQQRVYQHQPPVLASSTPSCKPQVEVVLDRQHVVYMKYFEASLHDSSQQVVEIPHHPGFSAQAIRLFGEYITRHKGNARPRLPRIPVTKTSDWYLDSNLESIEAEDVHMMQSKFGILHSPDLALVSTPEYCTAISELAALLQVAEYFQCDPLAELCSAFWAAQLVGRTAQPALVCLMQCRYPFAPSAIANDEHVQKIIKELAGQKQEKSQAASSSSSSSSSSAQAAAVV